MSDVYLATGANGQAIVPKDAEIQAALLTLARALDNAADNAAVGAPDAARRAADAKADAMCERLAAIAEYVERVEL